MIEDRALIAYLAGVTVGAAFVALAGLQLSAAGSTDLAYIWAGPRALLDGMDPYSAASWSTATARLGTPPAASAVYAYPPYVLIAILPIALVPIEALDVGWTCGSIGAAFIAMGLLLRAYLPGLPLIHGLIGIGLLTTQSSVQALFNVQWTFWLMAAVCGVLVLARRRRYALAGLVAATLLIKPHLFLLTLPALIVNVGARGRGRVAATVAVVATTGIGATIVVFPTWWISWFAEVALTRAVDPNLATLTVAADDLFGAPGRAASLVFVGVAVSVVARRVGFLDPAWPGAAIAASLAAAPYARSYDQPLLLISIALCAASVAGRGQRRAALAVAVAGVAGAWALSWGLLIIVAVPLRSESALGLVSAAVLLLCVVASMVGPRVAAWPPTDAA